MRKDDINYIFIISLAISIIVVGYYYLEKFNIKNKIENLTNAINNLENIPEKEKTETDKDDLGIKNSFLKLRNEELSNWENKYIIIYFFVAGIFISLIFLIVNNFSENFTNKEDKKKNKKDKKNKKK